MVKKADKTKKAARRGRKPAKSGAPTTGAKTYFQMNAEERRAFREKKAAAKAASPPVATPPASTNGNGSHAPAEALGFTGFRLVGEFTPLGSLLWRVEQRSVIKAGTAAVVPEWVATSGTFSSPVDAVQYIAGKVVRLDAVPSGS